MFKEKLEPYLSFGLKKPIFIAPLSSLGLMLKSRGMNDDSAGLLALLEPKLKRDFLSRLILLYILKLGLFETISDSSSFSFIWLSGVGLAKSD